MRVAVTGASGQVGHWIAAGLVAAGHETVALGRRAPAVAGVEFAPWELGAALPDLGGADALVHAAFAHVPGRYRGGEGDDPAGFRRLNLEGTVRLFAAARDAGVGRIVFLSTRAVYGDYPPGTPLDEGLPPRPDTLYGAVKAEAEAALSGLAGPGLAVASLRATGVYGPRVPGQVHKWDDLFAAFRRGDPVAPRAATEVHAGDVADAVRRLLESPPAALAPGVFNLSDFVLDRRTLLALYARLAGIDRPLPEAADAARVSAMTTARLRALGWRPRGPVALEDVVRSLVAAPPEGAA